MVTHALGSSARLFHHVVLVEVLLSGFVLNSLFCRVVYVIVSFMCKIMGVEPKMDTNSSDDEINFIKRPSILVHHSEELSDDDSRPVTPPMGQSMKLNKSLGIIMSPQSPPYRKIRSMKIVESPRPFLKSRLDHALTSTPNMSPCAQNSFKRNNRTSSLRLHRSRLSHFNQSDMKDRLLSPAAYINPFSPNFMGASKANESKTKNSTKR